MVDKLWTYDKPTEPGFYYLNDGDVVTRDSIEVVRVKFGDDGVLEIEEIPLELLRDDFKFMPLSLTEMRGFTVDDLTALNACGNE